MSSNLKVNTILPSTGTTVTVSGISSVTSSISAGSSITGTTFYGSGANLTGVLSNIVEDTSPQLGANLDVNGANILFGDSSAAGTNLNRLKFGAGTDLHIWHNASTGNSNISNYNGNLYLQGNNGSGTGVNQIAILSNAAVELNYQGTKKLETTSSGITLSDQLQVNGSVFASAGLKINADNQKLRIGANDDLQIYHTGTVSFIDDLTTASDGVSIRSKNIRLQSNANVGAKSALNCIANGAVELFHNDTKQCETSANGLEFPAGKGVYLGGSNAVNKLDHYQTGQWVPEVIDANGSNYSINYTANETRYVRIGNLVYCYYNIQNAENGSKTGDLRLRGWPFTCFGFQVGGSYWVDHSSPSAGLGDIVGGTHYINRVSGNNLVYWVKPTDKSGMGYASSRYLSHGQWSFGRWIYGSFTYHISGS